MPYQSGRTLAAIHRSYVIEGRRLYVTQGTLLRMHTAIARHNTTRPVPDHDGAALAALRVAGLTEAEIEAAHGRGFEVIVDWELDQR